MNTSRSANAGASSGGAVYGLGLIGALVFYWQVAGDGVWNHVLAILQALVWPAFLVYDLLRHIRA